MSLAIQLSGLLFLLIIIILILCDILGHGTISDLDSDAKLHKINEDPNKFTISFVLLVMENIIILLLAVMLFLAFSHYSLLLGTIWVVFRVSEGLIQIYEKKNFWNLLHMAERYSSASDDEKNHIIELSREILQRKIGIFTFGQILFSVGTLAYSIMFVFYETRLELIGWFGIIAAIIYGFGNGAKLLELNLEVVWNIGGLLILIFELTLGIWLLLFL